MELQELQGNRERALMVASFGEARKGWNKMGFNERRTRLGEGKEAFQSVILRAQPHLPPASPTAFVETAES